MWKAFLANPGHASAKQLSIQNKLALLDRSCKSVLRYRCSRWPPQKTVKRELDATQRKMAACLLHVKPLGHECPAEFARRRNHLASGLCRQMGWWSSRWWQRSREWDAHIRRPRNSTSWCHALVHWHDQVWLAEKRALASGSSVGTSRTKTRAVRGCVHQRWETGIDLAIGA